ncbi:MAG: hypothetical protein H7Z19_13035 [Chitinophagaceae bacterium]|nr:hypothetical protein [Rubrivivax sp.]
MKFRSFALSLAGTAACLVVGSASAEEFRCTGTVGAVALDNIFVPDGASCTLNRTRLNGNIVVGRGAQLYAGSVSVNGNLQAEGAASVVLGGFSTIGGSVQIVQGGSASIERARINGDLLFDENTAGVAATGNTIGGSLQAFQNLGGVVLQNNRIKGNLQCKENIPAPTGGGNQASSKEDQCSRL